MSGKQLPPIVREVRRRNLTYLDEDALLDLYEAVSKLEKNQVEGLLIEAGCALGGSAIVMASAKSQDRELCVYDVFGMIPPPTEKDEADVHQRYETIRKGTSKGLGGDTYYGYEDDLIAKVEENFEQCSIPLEENRIHLVQGLFEDTIQINSPVALAHIDGDWYASVHVCLERITPHLVEGGRFVIDDYDHWSGCRNAVDDFFSDKKDSFAFEHHNRLHIVRKG